MNVKRIERIINDYKNKYQGKDLWVVNSVIQQSLEKAIEVSANATNEKKQKHRHQYRIPKNSLKEFEAELLAKKLLIKKVENFDQLHNLIDVIKIYGIGELTKYDTTLRIGAFLKIFPDKIYLHSGTRIGAEIFVGKTKKKYILKEQLPEPFWDKNLTASDIEDILCIYKKKLATCK